MNRLLRAILSASLFHRFLHLIISTYSRTLQLKIENEADWQHLVDNGTPVLLCAWHQQFFSAIRPFERYQKYRPALMISQSRDGSIIAAVARHSGWIPVRGSSSRGGRGALRDMIRHLESNKLAAHILDGPTGPIGVVKAGAVRLAHAAHAVIIPFSVSARRAWFFNSWDRFMLPLPFSKVTLTFGQPVRFTPTDDRQIFERQRSRLEAMMRVNLFSGRSVPLEQSCK
jgi:hypothetical protein